MQTLEYTVTFTTPAFLGNAEQNGQWRTPPFKALLRQWWRVVYAADHGFVVNVDAMRQEEGRLFGNAWLEGKFCKSRVRIRLDRWDEGKLRQWPGPDVTIQHPEVQQNHGNIGSNLYLGFGPLRFQGGTALKANAAIQSGESAKLSLAVPDEHVATVKQALALINAYGSLGGRSRNGWGSLALAPMNDESTLDANLASFRRPWRDCLNLDWPHAIGREEEKPLIWQTAKVYDDWKAVMRVLAIVKIGLRTQFVFPNAPTPHAQPLERHWLSYPITRHTTKAWNRNARLPNSLRFKVRPDAADPKKLRGVIFHVPCLPPPEFRPDRKAIESTWRQVHDLLDQLASGSKRNYPIIADTTRRDALKPQLDTVTLERISE